MLTLLHKAFSNPSFDSNGMDFLMENLFSSLGNDFSKFVDGGAGIGHVTKSYIDKFKKYSIDGMITAYEPLPENFKELQDKIKGHTLRNFAISNVSGDSNFFVPNRIPESDKQEGWITGTSFNGHLYPTANPDDKDVINVKTIRLDEDLTYQPDFIKLDLQGGEELAIKGLGKLLNDVKILYLENILFSGNSIKTQRHLKTLEENGFIILHDELQFSVVKPQLEIKKLKSVGLTIDFVWQGNGKGIPRFCKGHFNSHRNNLFDNDYNLNTELIDDLKKFTIGYLQTDTICINKKYADKILPILNKLPIGY
jgi:FkbM family methyltransferase